MSTDHPSPDAGNDWQQQQGSPQQQWPQQQPPHMPPPPQAFQPNQPIPSGNGLGVAGFVTGLLGLLFFWIPIIGLALAVLGVTMGGAGVAQGRKVPGTPTGLAIAGLVLGIIALVPTLLILIALLGA